MFGFLHIKVLLLGLLVVSPAVGVWSYRSQHSWVSNSVKHANTFARPLPPADPVVRIPVEVIANGSTPEWVYVEVGTQAVPEPGLVSLLALTTLLLVSRRQRG